MQRKMAEDTYEIVYPGITEEALQNLREQPEIARAGLQYSLGTDDNNETGGLLSMTYGDEDALYACLLYTSCNQNFPVVFRHPPGGQMLGHKIPIAFQ